MSRASDKRLLENRLVLRVLDEGRRLIELLKTSSRHEVPYEGLARALRNFDSSTQTVRRPPPAEKSSGIRVFRDDIKEGEYYLLHAPLKSPEPVQFRVVAVATDDNAPGMSPPSFWAEVDDQKERWYWADVGLEPYRRFSKDPWWHEENWVSYCDWDPDMIDRILESCNALDDGFFDDPNRMD